MALKYKDRYVFDINYVSGYYKELSPLFINFCLLSNGIEPPNIEEEFTYCELGCGKTTNLLIMAANYPNAKFYGIDFNPSHIKYGQYMAKKANLSNVTFYNLSFGDAIKNKKLFPKFDYIVFHGVYTWVAKYAQKELLKFCDKKLKIGGVVYNSYNAYPGCATRANFQKLMIETSFLDPNRSDERAAYSLKVMDEFVKEMPLKNDISSSLEPAKKQNKAYLSHEYLNLDWSASYFIDVEKKFSKKGLEYVSICDPVEAFSSYILPAKLNNFLGKHFKPKTPLYEHFKDYALNRTFRKDLYVKGVKHCSMEQVRKHLESYSFALIDKNTPIEKNIQQGSANISLSDNICAHFNKALKNVATFDSTIMGTEISLTLFYLALFVSSGKVRIINNNLNKSKHSQLNQALCEEFSSSNDIEQISAFNIKDAVSTDFIDRLFYLFYTKENTQEVENIQDKIMQYLKNQNINITISKDDKDSNDTAKYISNRFKHWRKNVLPTWIDIGVVEQ